MAQSFPLPQILPMRNLTLTKLPIDFSVNSTTLSKLVWKKSSKISPASLTRSKCERRETRLDNFSELRSTWSLNNGQQLITDMVATSNTTTTTTTGGGDLIYISGIKPLSIAQMNPQTGELVEVAMTDSFQSAWRAYYPRIKLIRTPPGDRASVIVHEETANVVYKVDFDALEVEELDKEVLLGAGLVTKAKKAITKYFADQNNVYKIISGTGGSGGICVEYRLGSNQVGLQDFEANLELSLSLEGLEAENEKLKINQITQLNETSLLVAVYNGIKSTNSAELSHMDLKYLIIKHPARYIEFLQENILNISNYLNPYNMVKSNSYTLVWFCSLKNRFFNFKKKF